jgi:hypothetical protein
MGPSPHYHREKEIKLHRHMEFLTGYAPVVCYTIKWSGDAPVVCCAPSMQPPQRMHIASCYEAVLWL